MSNPEERCMPPYDDWSRAMDHRMAKDKPGKTAKQVALATRFHGERPVLATTEHGTHLFDVVGVHGSQDSHVIINLRTIQSPTACGGCVGIGSHKKHCVNNPTYSRWRELADKAEALGDTIGSNDPGLANVAYRLSGLLKAKVDGVIAGDSEEA